MKVYKLSVILFFLINAFAAHSESTIGKKLLMKPIDYQNPIGTLVGDKPKRSVDQLPFIWIVYSDRENNSTFLKADGQTKLKTMKFGEAFFVIGDEGSYIHIVKFDNTPGIYNAADYKLKKDLEDYGWVSKDKMLLWNKCLVDETTKFSIKALCVNSPENLDKLTEYVKGKNLKLFSDPQIMPSNENNKDVRIFEFLYVYKEDNVNNSCLIGLQPQILKVESDQGKRLLLGWVSQKVVKKWKSRETLEWNSDPAAVDERKSKGVKISITKTEQGASQVKSAGAAASQNDVLDDKDTYSIDREDPQSLRLPFFNREGSKGDIVLTGYKTAVYDLTGHEVMSVKQQAEVLKAYEKAKSESKNTNIIFVVDGSDIMKNYAPAIQNIMANTANKLRELSLMNAGEDGKEKINYKMGAVVYRDYSEKECTTGSISDFQVKKLTNNYNDIVSFFTNDVTFARCKDKDNRQAVYMGVSKAADLLQGCEKQSNLIVVLGAGANRVNDKAISQDELVKKLALYNCPIFAFQVKFPSVQEHDAYDDFNGQFKKIIIGVAQALRDNHNKKFPDDPKPGAVNLERDENTANFYQLNTPKLSPIPGAIMYSDELNNIDPEHLTGSFLNMLEQYRATNEQILEASESKLKGQGERTVIDEGTLNFFTKINVDPKVLQKAAVTNIQLFVEGYTPITCDKLTNPLYKYTVFVDGGELASLIEDFKKIANGSKDKSQRRQDIQDVFKSLLAFRIGDKNAKTKIKIVDIETLMASISGRSTRKESIYSAFKIADITDPKKVKDDILDQLTELIQNKLIDLDNYSKAGDTFFMSNGARYYWVPDEMLP